MPKVAQVQLSKSKVMLGIQCEKYLYLSSHQPELASEASADQQARFDQGHIVGQHAQNRFPGGRLITATYGEPDLALKQTEEAIASGENTIYEATFRHEGVLVKVDILHRASDRSVWEIIEVKSGTKVKPEYVQDAGIQLWVLIGAGLKVKSVSVMHINNKCIFPNLEDLFTRVDVIREAKVLLPTWPEFVAKLKKVLAERAAPDADIGPHCDSPYECSFREHCWAAKKIPELSIFNLPKLNGDTAWDLYSKGKLELDQLSGVRLSETQRRVVDVSISGERFVDGDAIAAELETWKYPLYFLDFETINPAIPRFDGTRPYQQVPFQFSCHIQEKGGRLKHREYLHDAPTDPRPELIRQLLGAIGERGSVVAYNKGFEGRCLDEMAQAFPALSGKLQKIKRRLVDPLPLIRKAVYDRGFKGSFSIKNVAPALLGDDYDYDDLVIGDGGRTQVAFEELMAQETSVRRKAELQTAMREYCKRDTQAMLKLVAWLRFQGAVVAQS